MKQDLLSANSHFAFGKNWLDYAKKIDENRISQAVADLQRLSGRLRFDGLSFLDIGSGSGLHSLAAIRMGAARVIGVDIDDDSVAASRNTIAKFAPDHINVRFDNISVFDMTEDSYGNFDVIYSWGVLHHTGDMYRALTSAASLVTVNGLFMIALYRKTPFCPMWRIIKQWYSSATPHAQRRAIQVRLILQRLLFRVKGRDLDEHIRTYSERRGMDFYNDIHDWMGGYPYESISPEECHTFFANLGFRLDREYVAKPSRYLPGLLGSGCDEYTFLRVAAA